MFEQVVGELDEILTHFEAGNLEELFADIFLHSKSEGEMKIKMDNLSSMIQWAQTMGKEEWKHGKQANPSIS